MVIFLKQQAKGIVQHGFSMFAVPLLSSVNVSDNKLNCSHVMLTWNLFSRYLRSLPMVSCRPEICFPDVEYEPLLISFYKHGPTGYPIVGFFICSKWFSSQ